ncbi:threonine ammonia-lyase IlvA [Hymenobacter cellulosivorans]|uniref:L-threonine dehydratase n=1 Tax=Hymenobacter cellulosivorans TaxID=2932249 RepID=A0ABY4F8W3_9BACT|nr:threonine ammonia-lyase IlvA [Hymenobacter cellulosivorans]UOQ53107.1 threonine ammonia-lyase IlvA [Hymenobacter cellulosivorans]
MHSETIALSAPTVLLESVEQAARNLQGVIYETLLQQNLGLSAAYGASIYLKREDLQVVRSYKIRGAYNKISQLAREQDTPEVVCASAGNHAQGVAYACQLLGLKGYIFMPANTPAQKVSKVRLFGKEQVEVVLTGNTFDDTFQAAKLFCDERGSAFVHPFDDLAIVEGQATVGLEILKAAPQPIDYVFMPIGGGGLASGVGSVFRQLSPHTKLIGVQPLGAPSMQQAIQTGRRQALEHIESFVDGAAVKCPGALTFELCRALLDDVVLVPEGQVCEDLLRMYNEEGIVLEPAGTLSISALRQFADEIRGKTVVCVLSGSNNDITRMEDIKERAMRHKGLKHYFMVTFNQRPGALRRFVNNVLHPDDDIIHFQYIKKNNKEKGPVFVGIEVRKPHEIEGIQQRMREEGFAYEYLNGKQDFLSLLV